MTWLYETPCQRLGLKDGSIGRNSLRFSLDYDAARATGEQEGQPLFSSSLGSPQEEQTERSKAEWSNTLGSLRFHPVAGDEKPSGQKSRIKTK